VLRERPRSAAPDADNGFLRVQERPGGFLHGVPDRCLSPRGLWPPRAPATQTRIAERARRFTRRTLPDAHRNQSRNSRATPRQVFSFRFKLSDGIHREELSRTQPQTTRPKPESRDCSAPSSTASHLQTGQRIPEERSQNSPPCCRDCHPQHSTALGFTSGVTRDNFWLEQCGDLADGVVFPRKQTAPYSPGPRAAPRNRYETWSQLTHGGSNGSERASSADTQRHAPGTSGTGTEPAAQRALFACSSFWVSSKTPGWRRAPR